MFGIHRQVLYSRSRNRPLLLRLGLTIVGISVGLALLIWILIGGRFSPENRFWEAVRTDPEAMLDFIRVPLTPKLIERARQDELSEEKRRSKLEELAEEVSFVAIAQRIAGSTLSPDDKALFTDFAAARNGIDTEKATDRILKEARQPGRLYANEMMGYLVANPPDARKYFEEELRRRPSVDALNSILLRAMHEGNVEEYRRLARDPGFQWGASSQLMMAAAVKAKDFGTIFFQNLRLTAGYMQPYALVVVLFSGMIWLILLAQGAGFRKDQLILYGVAIVLGMMSAIFTFFAGTVQEEVYGKMVMQPDVVGGLIASIAGIGLREEWIKLLFFLPLLPWLLKRENEMEALVVASLVGLGFSLDENLFYLDHLGDRSAIGRFIIASFLHSAMTGLIGHAAYRMARRWRNWDQFLATFLIVVCVHGVYDAIILVEDLKDYSPLTIVVVAVLAYYYFELSERLPWTGDKHLSPLAVFVLGLSFQIGLTLNVLCFGLEPLPHYLVFLLECVVLVPVAFIYVNRYSRT